MQHQVKITSEALFQMVAAGLEAYCIPHPHKKDSGIECFGRLWGDYKGTARTSKLTIKSLTIDTSARMNRGSVASRNDTEALKLAVHELFKDDFEYLGDFHTHPYKQEEVESAKEVRRQQLYHFSSNDVQKSYASVAIEDTDLMLSVVLTLYGQQRTSIELDGRIDDNTLEFSIGNVKCWLHAQIYNVAEQCPEETYLTSDFIESFLHICSTFRHKE